VAKDRPRPAQGCDRGAGKYLHDQDSLSQWIEERCAVDRVYSASSSALYINWKGWTEVAGERPGSQKSFSQALETRGFERKYERTGATFFGIALRPEGLAL
jgi:putative DNA primase/helicase